MIKDMIGIQQTRQRHGTRRTRRCCPAQRPNAANRGAPVTHCTAPRCAPRPRGSYPHDLMWLVFVQTDVAEIGAKYAELAGEDGSAASLEIQGLAVGFSFGLEKQKQA